MHNRVRVRPFSLRVVFKPQRVVQGAILDTIEADHVKLCPERVVRNRDPVVTLNYIFPRDRILNYNASCVVARPQSR